jgi:DNA-binding transcriptional regulator GbsR (MarR family)
LGTAMPPMQKHKHYSIESKINKKFEDFTSLQTRNEIHENKQANKQANKQTNKQLTQAEFKNMKHS